VETSLERVARSYYYYCIDQTDLGHIRPFEQQYSPRTKLQTSVHEAIFEALMNPATNLRFKSITVSGFAKASIAFIRAR